MENTSTHVQPSRYTDRFDETPIHSDVNDSDISKFTKRIAANNEIRNEYCTNNVLCDYDDAVEDCPQNNCIYKYLDPKYDILDVNRSSKRIFYNKRIQKNQIQNLFLITLMKKILIFPII